MTSNKIKVVVVTEPIASASIKLSVESKTLKIGEEFNIEAIVTGSTKTPEWSFTSDSGQIEAIKVDDTHYTIKAKRQGTGQIIATLADSTPLSATCIVTVNPTTEENLTREQFGQFWNQYRQTIIDAISQHKKEDFTNVKVNNQEVQIDNVLYNESKAFQYRNVYVNTNSEGFNASLSSKPKWEAVTETLMPSTGATYKKIADGSIVYTCTKPQTLENETIWSIKIDIDGYITVFAGSTQSEETWEEFSFEYVFNKGPFTPVTDIDSLDSAVYENSETQQNVGLCGETLVPYKLKVKGKIKGETESTSLELDKHFTSTDFEIQNLSTINSINNCTNNGNAQINLEIKALEPGYGKYKTMALYDSNNVKVSEDCIFKLPSGTSPELRYININKATFFKMSETEKYHIVASDLESRTVSFEVTNYNPEETEWGTCCYTEAKEVCPGDTVELKIHSNSAAGELNFISKFSFFNNDEGTDYHGYGYVDNQVTITSSDSTHHISYMVIDSWAGSKEVSVGEEGSDVCHFREGETITFKFVPDIDEIHNYEFKLYAEE